MDKELFVVFVFLFNEENERFPNEGHIQLLIFPESDRTVTEDTNDKR